MGSLYRLLSQMGEDDFEIIINRMIDVQNGAIKLKYPINIINRNTIIQLIKNTKNHKISEETFKKIFHGLDSSVFNRELIDYISIIKIDMKQALDQLIIYMDNSIKFIGTIKIEKNINEMEANEKRTAYSNMHNILAIYKRITYFFNYYKIEPLSKEFEEFLMKNYDNYKEIISKILFIFSWANYANIVINNQNIGPQIGRNMTDKIIENIVSQISISDEKAKIAKDIYEKLQYYNVVINGSVMDMLEKHMFPLFGDESKEILKLM